MTLSIIIPCYNEISTIETVIDRVLANNDYKKEIIVIDDFSTDGTREILKEKLSDKITKLILNEKINLAVQINGKTKDVIEIKKDLEEKEVVIESKKSKKINNSLNERKIIKIFMVVYKVNTKCLGHVINIQMLSKILMNLGISTS